MIKVKIWHGIGDMHVPRKPMIPAFIDAYMNQQVSMIYEIIAVEYAMLLLERLWSN